MNLWYELLPVVDTPIGSAWLIGARVAVVAVAATEYHVRTRGLAGPGPRSLSEPLP